MNMSTIPELARKALLEGYIVKPFHFADEVDKKAKLNALSKNVEDIFLRNFILEHIVDRLTYIKDYMIKNSINFMVMVKDVEGNVVGVGNFIYSKSSNMLYIRTYKTVKNAEPNKILALLISGAKDCMGEYGFQTKAVIASSQLDKKNMAHLKSMEEIGMKQIVTEQKLSLLQSEYLLMMEKFVNERIEFNKDKLLLFLRDLNEEKELVFLLNVLEDSDMKIQLRKLDTEKLIALLEKTSG
ncbi:MAG: hypothetical protein ACPLYF_02055 [Fervidobacterium sp.]